MSLTSLAGAGINQEVSKVSNYLFLTKEMIDRLNWQITVLW